MPACLIYHCLFSDNVRFGDVVVQPPSITAKPRKAAEANKVCRGTSPVQFRLDYSSLV